ncbi:MAG: PAS domain-containing protein [Polyangiales bacterium]
MSKRPFEMILLRQLAGHLSLPVLLADTAGNLIFYNEGAELVLGRRFDETGELPPTEWEALFIPRDEQGATLPPGALPLSVALRTRRPAHRRFEIRGLDGILRHVEATAVPVLALDGGLHGVAVFLWESPT